MMKIVIDPGEALRNANLPHAPQLSGPRYVLPVPMEPQRKSRWCWAALSCALARYYGLGTMDQEALAFALLSSSATNHTGYSNEDIREGNLNFKLDHALKHVGCFSHWTAGKPSFERVVHELNLARPFCVRIEWYAGGAHYVLVHGYDEEAQTLLVADPMHGSSEMAFALFPKHYRGRGAVWTETYWTDRQTIK